MSFSGKIKKFSDKAERRMHDVARMSFIQVSTRVIRRSPVGDAAYWKGRPPKGYTGGRFRANWQASINSPAKGAIDTEDSPETNQGRSTSSVSKAAKIKKARSYYLMNNLPYAARLEGGYSRQAREGIVKLAVAEWDSIVDIVSKMVR